MGSARERARPGPGRQSPGRGEARPLVGSEGGVRSEMEECGATLSGNWCGSDVSEAGLLSRGRVCGQH